MTRQIKKKILLENEIKSFVNFFVDILLFFVGSKFSNIYIYVCVCGATRWFQKTIVFPHIFLLNYKGFSIHCRFEESNIGHISFFSRYKNQLLLFENIFYFLLII